MQMIKMCTGATRCRADEKVARKQVRFRFIRHCYSNMYGESELDKQELVCGNTSVVE